jgi:hypothetical protein
MLRHTVAGPGKANSDDRSFCCIRVPELPWPLRFDFILAEESDGKRHHACVGFEVGEAVPRDEQRDVDEFGVTQERLAILWENALDPHAGERGRSGSDARGVPAGRASRGRATNSPG